MLHKNNCAQTTYFSVSKVFLDGSLFDEVKMFVYLMREGFRQSQAVLFILNKSLMFIKNLREQKWVAASHGISRERKV